MKIKQSILAVLSVFILSISAFANNQHQQHIRDVLQKLDAGKLAVEGAMGEFNRERAKNSDPKMHNYLTCVEKSITEDYFLDLMSPIFAKHVSFNDAENALNILNSSFGQKAKAYVNGFITEKALIDQLSNKEKLQLQSYTGLTVFDVFDSDTVMQEVQQVAFNQGMELGKPCMHHLM